MNYLSCSLFAAANVVLLLSGCGETPKPTRAPIEAFFPVRQDWLISGKISTVPTRFHDRGMTPIMGLSLSPEEQNSEQKAFFRERELNVIRDTNSLSPEERKAFETTLTKFFGTPAAPKIPLISELFGDPQAGKKFSPEMLAELKDVNSELRLDPETLARGEAIFRNYCVSCHGLTGDGNGSGARFLIPLPRDYRAGLFKFITSDFETKDQKAISSRKPRRDDLHRTIFNGLPGSDMTAFAGLPEADIQAVISYVIFLSIRGECEQKAMEPILRDGSDEPEKEIPEQITKQLLNTLLAWKRSEENPIVPDPNPYNDEEKQLLSAALGYKVFMDANQGGCTACHTGFGKNAPYQYDIWGSVVRPRDLLVATLRGGRNPDQLYARLYGGIQGSNMPEFRKLRPTEEDKSKGRDKLWNLVHFMQAVSDANKRRALQDSYKMDALFKKYNVTDYVQVSFD